MDHWGGLERAEANTGDPVHRIDVEAGWSIPSDVPDFAESRADRSDL